MIAVLALLPWASAEIIATFSQAATAKTRVDVARARVKHLLDSAEHKLARSKPTRESFIASPSELEVQNLRVAWDEKVVVNDVSFALRRGQKIALIGPSGSGKSSIAAAVLRLVEHGGSVSLDEVPVERLTDFRQHVVALMQSTHVFSASLRENLLIANGYASDADITLAIRKAGLTNWLESLPQGLDTQIGSSGQPMSGGEIQRLGIARLLVSQAAFIVLDEPTEHLDDATAAKVWQTILDSFADRGLLIITHDRAVMDSCDYVLQLQNGQLRNTLTQ
jgi:ABC-type transport system involved in cytochrome bd biosynthesis fused ATPase/permease subunit